MQKIIVSGNLGKDAEVKKLESGRSYVYFNVAVNSYKGKGDDRRTVTQWYNVSYFVNSEAIIQYLKKGAKVVVVGNLELDTFRSEQSGKVYVNASILASDVEIVGFVDTEQPQSTQTGVVESIHASLPPIAESDNSVPAWMND